jgi:acyl carrier protein
MDKKKILKKLEVIFRDVFKDKKINFKKNITSQSYQKWDSLAHLTLISLIEHEFKVKFLLDEISEIKSVNQIVNSIFLKKNK